MSEAPLTWEICQVSGDPQTAASNDLLALDGDPADPDAASAAACSIILRNCDVLVAWGNPRALPLSGTIRQALGLGIPVLSLTLGQPERLLLDSGWHVARDAPLEGEAAWTALRQNLDTMLAPPGAIPEAIDRLTQGAALPDRKLWRANRAAMSLLWKEPPGAESSAAPPRDWAVLYSASDGLAGGYADRYRSSYTLVLGLAAIALIAAVLGLALHDANPVWSAIPEAACLVGIIVLVRANTRLDWRSRLILFRLLSELCRKQAALAIVGRSLPTARIAQMTGDSDLAWVGWRFSTTVRAAAFPSGSLAGDALATARDAAAAVLLKGQRAYHEARIEGGRRREARLVQLGGWTFGLTVLCVLVKVILLGFDPEHAEWFGLVAALLPAVAAALFGFRAYAELELLVQHSERMVHTIDQAERSLERTDITQPLASQHVGDVLEATAIAMLSDVEGWIQISRVKAVEAG